MVTRRIIAIAFVPEHGMGWEKESGVGGAEGGEGG